MFRFGDQIAINGMPSASLRLRRTARTRTAFENCRCLGRARGTGGVTDRQRVLPSNMSREGECCGMPRRDELKQTRKPPWLLVQMTP